MTKAFERFPAGGRAPPGKPFGNPPHALSPPSDAEKGTPMGLTQELIRKHLDRVDSEGWNGSSGRELLELVRCEIVRPLVRRSGLRGLAADQAEATGWEVAWQTLDRPSTRVAENPGGMVWVAVRRGIHAEAAAQRVCSPGVRRVDRPGLAASRLPTGDPTSYREMRSATSAMPEAWVQADPNDDVRSMVDSEGIRQEFEGGSAVTEGTSNTAGPASEGALSVPAGPFVWAGRIMSLDAAMAYGFEPVASGASAAPVLGPILELIADSLVEHRWAPDDVRDAIAILAENVRPDGSGGLSGPWRLVAMRLGIAEWRARRLAELLLGGEGWPGLVVRIAREGDEVLGDPDVVAAMRSTGCRWARTPRALLAGSMPSGIPDLGTPSAGETADGCQAGPTNWRTA